ncbi:MAG: uroporphyrinogen decarboxylase family protein [Candidatus Bathyarchaeota archaeon]|nr:uroporphyrinogen decarboxylase family protein [Candidatus Bathyarchaeota archaeon]
MASIRHEEPDRVPIYAGLDAKFEEILTGRRHAKSKSYIGGGVPVAKEVKMTDYEALEWNQKLSNDAIRKLGTDIFIVSDYWLWPRGYEPRYIDEHTFVDWWGKMYRLLPKVGTNYWVDGIIKTEEDLDSFVPPDPDEMNYDLVDFVVRDARNGDYPVVGAIHLAGMFPYLMMGGLDRFCINLYAKPRFTEKVLKMVAEVQTKIATNIIDRGVDIIAETDDIAGVDGPFWPPKMMRRHIWPPIKRLVDVCHRRGIPYLKHTDGDIMPVLEEFMDFCGFDGLNPIEPQCMDMAEVKRRFGRRVYLRGNVDITWVIPYGTEEEVRRDVRRAIDQGAKGGGFVLSESNSFHPNCKFENILTYVDEAMKYGTYPCGKVEAGG